MTKTQQSPVLYLTKEEQKLLAALPKDLVKEWKVEVESLTCTDSPERRKARVTLAKFEDADLKKYLHALQQKSDADEVMALAGKLDFTKLSPDDIQELLFVLGADYLSASIATILSDASTAEALTAVSGLAGVRHAFYLSYSK